MPEWLKIDTDKMTVSGHSFGGITALRAAFLGSNTVKAVLGIDPWTYVHHDEIMAGKMFINVPCISVNSVDFNRLCTGFDFYKSIQAFLKNSKTAHKESYILKKINHEMQQDLCCLSPLEVALSEGLTPYPENPFLYFMHA